MKSPGFLQGKLREYFLENKHHLTLVITPDVSACIGREVTITTWYQVSKRICQCVC